MKRLTHHIVKFLRLAVLATLGVFGIAAAFADVPGRVIEEGQGPVRITLAEACIAGDLLGYSSGWKLADANNNIYAELVAGETGEIGQTITAYRVAVIAGTTSLGGTAGDLVYLSDTAGKYTNTSGTVGQVVGRMAAANRMLITPQYQILGGQLVPGALKLFFRDSGIYINSGADGKLTISADGAGADDITLDGKVHITDDLALATGKSFAMPGAGTISTGTGSTSMNGSLIIAEGKNIIVGTTTGTEIGTATAQKLGFYGATPIVQPGAYTQTYATADKTHANVTQNAITAVANVEGATANNEFQDSAGANPTQAEWRVLSKTLKTELNAIKADIADVKGVVNSIIDDLQALGLVG